MQKSSFKLIAVASLSLFLLGGTALAVGQAKAHAEDAATTGQSQAEVRKTEAETRLADAKLKACQKRETAINNIMARIASRGEKQIDVFNKIADRTEAFYVKKGKTLSTYDALVTDVNAKKAAAQTAVAAVKSSSVTFKCDGTDPKGAAASFKDSLKSEIAALKAYKTAVKNLIVGVKSVQSDATTDTNKTEGSQ